MMAPLTWEDHLFLPSIEFFLLVFLTMMFIIGEAKGRNAYWVGIKPGSLVLWSWHRSNYAILTLFFYFIAFFDKMENKVHAMCIRSKYGSPSMASRGVLVFLHFRQCLNCRKPLLFGAQTISAANLHLTNKPIEECDMDKRKITQGQPTVTAFVFLLTLYSSTGLFGVK